MPPPRPHPLSRSRAACQADRLITAIWANGLHRKPVLEPEALWQIGAQDQTPGDESFGRSPAEVADFRERLDLLCRSLRDEAQLNALGHTMAYGQLTAAVRQRHALGRLWRTNPGIEQTPIAPPIIVVGQMRAGTTRMHRLLAADPAHAGTPLYCGVDPVRQRFDLRPLKTRAGLAVARIINPWVDTFHPFGATRVDEEIAWLSHALLPSAFEAQYAIPSYVAFSEARDAGAVYREFARILRTDAALMGNAQLPRVLKCPQFAEDLPALLAQFPDARVVVTQREGPEVLASTVSLVASQMAYQSDHAALPLIEREWQRKLDLRDHRMQQALADFEGTMARVEYEALNADWQGEMVRVYATLGLPLTATARAAMHSEQGRAARQTHSTHGQSYREFAQA